MEAAAVEMAWILSLQRGRCLSHHHRMLKTANVLHYPTSDEISLDKIYHYAAFVVAWLVANRRHHLDGRWQPRIWTGPGGEQKLGTPRGRWALNETVSSTKRTQRGKTRSCLPTVVIWAAGHTTGNN